MKVTHRLDAAELAWHLAMVLGLDDRAEQIAR